MINVNKNIYLTLFFIFFCFCLSHAQDEEPKQNTKLLFKEINFLEHRGTNVVDASFGAALLQGDYPDSKADLYMKIGYKRHITANLNIGISVNKYDLTITDSLDQGYLSFDLNLEYLFNPDYELAPFIYAGYGYNATSDFENTQTKVQAGLGVEYVIYDAVGIRIFGEYNQVFSDETVGLIMPNVDDAFIRIGLGLNLYFGGAKRKEQLLSTMKTVINSNLIE